MQTTHEGLTATELVARVHGIGDLIRANAAAGERDRRLPEATIDALADADLLKLMVPRRYGGLQTSISTFLAVAAAVAEHDGATGWVMTLVNINAWAAGTFSAQAQDDIFGADPQARLCGVLAPSATTRRVVGGYRITGKWGFASGSLHAQWAMVGAPIVDPDGRQVDAGQCLVPMSDLTIEDTWYVAGMRGTGSNTLVADDVFVPDYRMQSTSRLIRGEAATPYTDESLYRPTVMIPLAAIVLAAPQVGLARAALAAVLAKAPTRPVSYTRLARQADSAAIQIELAKASMVIDTAAMHVERAAADLDEVLRSGRPMDMVERAKVRARTGYATECVREAIDMLMTVGGAGSFAEASSLQRIWRDSNTAGRHAIVSPIHNYEIFGRALLGFSVEDNITDLI
jgi:alkylation response protein AidB-like acyl-CoA dehydrogenase